MAIKIDLPPASKRTPYSRELVVIGPDWTDEAFRMELRNEPGDQGTPLVALDKVTSGQGIIVSYDPEFPVPNSEETAGATILNIRINETTLEGLPYTTPSRAELDLHYDIHLGAGSTKQVLFFGELPIRPGVTL